jgi:ABC-type transport system substrate-binding protein
VKRVLVLALLAAGCTTNAAPAVRPAADGARAGGTLRIGITQPGSLDPGNDYEPMGDLVLRTMCDPLIAADPRTGDLRPALVESWVVTDSGQRLVLRLRKGARFSDGTDVTADDVVHSLSRIASADYASAAAAQLSSIDGYREVHGDEETDNDLDRRRMKGVRALDDRSVEITLVRRQADFVRLLTSRLVTPVPRAAAAADATAFARSPVCAGPYALAAPFRPGDKRIVLRRSAAHLPVDPTLTNGGRGYADVVEFHVYADADAAAAAQQRGAVDVAAARPTDVEVQSGPGPLVEYVGLPTATAPVFDRPVVRRALARALDRQALVDAVFPGTRVPATGFLPPTTLPVFRADACGDALPAGGDVKGARADLAAAAVDLRDVQVTFYVNDDGRNLQLAREVAAQWKAAFGLTARPVPSTFDAFITRATSAAGFDGPFRFSWATPYPDPDGSLYPLFASDRIGRDNVSRFSDPQVDRALVRQAREAEAAGDRTADYRRAERLLCDAMPMIPLTFSRSRYLVSTAVGAAAGSLVDRTSGQFLVREAYLRPR